MKGHRGWSQRWWVWLARLSADTRTRTRAKWVVGAGAAAILVLAFLGWQEFNAEEPEVDISFVTAVYRSVAFFTGEAAEPYDVPWQLQVARLAALFVVGFGAFVGIAQLMTEFFMARGARKASDHIVFVGPSGSPEAALATRRAPFEPDREHGPSYHEKRATWPVVEQNGEPIVQVIGDGGSEAARRANGSQERKYTVPTDRITVHDDLGSDSWLEKTSAAKARLVVLSGGPDRRTMRLAFTLLTAFEQPNAAQPDGAHLIVNLHCWETAQWFDLLVARKYPDASLEVGCSSEAAIVERVIQRLRPDDADAPATTAQAPHHVLAIAGRGERCDTVVRLVVRHLEKLAVQSSSFSAVPLFLAGLGIEETPEAPHNVGSHRVRITPIDLRGPTHQTSPLQHALIFVVDDEEDRSNQLELQLSARFPDAKVISIGTEDLQSSSPQDFRSPEGLHILRGPTWRLSNCLLVDSTPASGSERVVDQGRIRRTRRVLHELGNAGFQIIAVDGDPRSRGMLSQMRTKTLTARMRDLTPFVGCVAPSDDYEVWNLQAAIRDAGYDFDDGAAVPS